jgi:hypothetical protein
MDEHKEKLRVVWRDLLSAENPEVPVYLIDTLVETYLLAPKDTEKIIMEHQKKYLNN